MVFIYCCIYTPILECFVILKGSIMTINFLDLYNDVQKFIENNKDSEFDIEDLRIGHSYFLVDKNDNGAQLEQRWKYEILPLLREYYKDGIITKDIPESSRTINAFRSYVNE